MAAKPFFSIVIPTLNEENYLPLLLTDLSKQTYQNFEVIVADGHSDDNTVIKARQLQPKLPHLAIYQTKARNVSTQRNLGSSKSTGQYVIFNDADNRLPNYFLEGLHYQLLKKPYDIFTCWLAPDSTKTGDIAITTYINALIETSLFFNQPAAFGALIGCRRLLNRKVKFDPKIGFSEDTHFIREAYQQGYSYNIFHDPRYVYSLRRLRKLGALKLIQKYAILNLKYLTKQKINQKQEYPMGGELFSRFAITDHNLTKKRPKLLEKIKTILAQLEES